MNFSSISKAVKETKLSYLGNINTSAKIVKNQKVSNNYTYILYLAPANESGYNVCPFSTAECRLGCLNNSGRNKVEIIAGILRIRNARLKKTEMFFEEREFFFNWLVAEIKKYQQKAKKDGYDFSVRLNGTSDIDWANEKHNNQSVFEMFPDVLFYDYTKNPNKFNNKPLNYHLTFSYTGKNWKASENLLNRGFNVAVVFDTDKKEELPEFFNGYKVVDGDLTDFRPNDGRGVIVGLRFKHIADKQTEEQVLNSVFVVKTSELETTKVEAA